MKFMNFGVEIFNFLFSFFIKEILKKMVKNEEI